MYSSGINGEGELRGQPANPGSPGKWPLKQCVCVCVEFMSGVYDVVQVLCTEELKVSNGLCWHSRLPLVAVGTDRQLRLFVVNTV